MSIIKQAVALLYMLSVLLVGAILSGSFSSASAQECPVLFSPTAVAPSQAYDYTSPAFESLFSSLQSMIKSYITQHQIPSYAVAVVHEGRTILSSGLTRTPFRIASITKTFTALGALILREQGRLSLDDPVKTFLPSFSIINPFDGQQHDTTLRELMGHAAGFPMQLCPEFQLACTNNETEILEQISGMQLVSPPWSQFPAYSNLGFALLGRAWEKATDPPVSWEDFVTDNILKPLRMTSSGVNVTGVQLAPNSHPWALQDIGWSAPAGQMYSTAEDLAKYLAFLLTTEPRLVTVHSLREWTSTASIFADGKGGYSFPWELKKLHEKSLDFLFTKGGSINGYVSHLGFDLSTRLGVVVLAVLEGGSSGSPDELAGNIMRTLIPAVQSINQDMIADVYAGVYTCPASKPFATPNWDFKVQVRDGIINVSVSPTVGLLADVRIDVLNGGIPVTSTGTWALLLKNETENSFWFGDGSSCYGIVGAVGAGPDLKHPNTPGSFYSNVIVFDPVKGSLHWPAGGGHCYKAGFEPSERPSRTRSFLRAIFSFFMFFFAF